MNLEKLYSTIEQSQYQSEDNLTVDPASAEKINAIIADVRAEQERAEAEAQKEVETKAESIDDDFEDDDLSHEFDEAFAKKQREDEIDQIIMGNDIVGGDNSKVIMNLNSQPPVKVEQYIPAPEQQVQKPKSRENLPDVIRCRNLKPIAKIQVYSISSEQMREYVIRKIHHFFPGIPVNLVFMFTKPKKSERGPKGFASARLLVGDQVLDPAQRARTYYDRLGDPGKLQFLPNFQYNVIEKYKYNREQINSLLNNYKEMSKAEDIFGFDEKFLNDIRAYIIPKKLEVNQNLNAVILSVMPENIIQDMLTNIRSGRVNGKIEIKEIYMNKDVIHFIVYLHPEDLKSQQNSLVGLFLDGINNGVKVY